MPSHEAWPEASGSPAGPVSGCRKRRPRRWQGRAPGGREGLARGQRALALKGPIDGWVAGSQDAAASLRPRPPRSRACGPLRRLQLLVRGSAAASPGRGASSALSLL